MFLLLLWYPTVLTFRMSAVIPTFPDLGGHCKLFLLQKLDESSLYCGLRWHGFIGGPDKALSLAQQKLVFGDFKPSDQNQALAILGQRFGLDVIFGHPETTAFLDEAVASHMRICLSVTADRLRLNTSYPSEPVLSNAAASLLHERDDSVEACLKALNATLQRGMVDKGQRGEMLSRILLLLGRDAATPPAPAQTPPGFLRYCQPIKLLDFLKVTFGDYFTSAAIQSDFENAYINISHWVSMKENIVPSRKRMGGDFECAPCPSTNCNHTDWYDVDRKHSYYGCGSDPLAYNVHTTNPVQTRLGPYISTIPRNPSPKTECLLF